MKRSRVWALLFFVVVLVLAVALQNYAFKEVQDRGCERDPWTRIWTCPTEGVPK